MQWPDINTYGIKRWQLYALAAFIILGALHKFIANEVQLIQWQPELSILAPKKETSKGIGTLIPYSYNTIDKKNRNVGPFSPQNVSSLYYRHWLGTDPIGRDVLAGLLSGTNIALKIGFFAVLFTLLIGIFFGYLSGYVGDDGFRIKWYWLCCLVLISGLAVFYFITGNSSIKILAALISCPLLYFIIKQADSEDHSKGTLSIPFDLIVMRIIEVFKAIPSIFLVLVMIALVSQPSILNVIIIVTLVRWPTVTRFLRAEIIATKKENFVTAAKAIGLPQWTIFKDTILPLAISPAIVASAFAFSSAILTESTLSFLGIGIPVDIVTWGSLLSEARERFSSWWLAIFPGLMIYLTIFLFNSIGDSINEHLRGIGSFRE